ncbi:MAG: RluA family pseudouridine synthase [Alkaliphilus sp.]
MSSENFLVSEENENIRLDIFVSELYSDLSRSYIQKLIKEKQITVNAKTEKNKYLVQIGDEIVVNIPVAKELTIKAQNIPIVIVYEDEDLLVINKEQNMVVHPAPGNYDGTVVNAIMYHCKGKLSSINGIIRPGIVHRIDKNTSGLLVIAKNDTSHRSLAEQFKDHTVVRKYEAIVRGRIKEDRATIDAPIKRHPTNRLKMATSKDGRNAITHIKVIERFSDDSYIEARLETGRTHQIRVHLSYINHPLVGDVVYGSKSSGTKFNLEGQVLHAKTLGFIHPRSKEFIEFNSELPESFNKVLRTLREKEIKMR